MKSFIPLILSSILILCFQNCGPGFQAQQSDNAGNFLTDPAFVAYVQEFEYYNRSSVSHIPIGFVDLKDEYAGMCHRISYGGRVVYAYIEIDKEYWGRASELQKINLIFHELGHCALNRDHPPADSVRMCPTSFMHYQIMSDWCLQEHFNEYMEEMFPWIK